MPVRERFFDAMRRKCGDYVPFEFKLCPSLLEEFRRRTGMESPEEYYDFPVRVLIADCTVKDNRFSKYYEGLEGINVWPDWGVGERRGSVAHFTEMLHPMRDFTCVGDFAGYPYPDLEKDYDWAGLSGNVAAVRDRDLVAAAAMQVTIFEIAWYLRGMDNFMVDMVLNPELACCHLDRITGIRCQMARKYAEAGSDVLLLGDDVSTQLDMMMNPEMWREYFKPRLSGVIEAAREVKPDILVFYHGDGNLQKIIPDLIEIGVDILNPVQPECMDPAELKRMYGDRLSFWGAVGTQTTMPFGTAEEVARVCRKMIDEVGQGGGLLLAPTHVLEPEVPWENIQAFIDTVKGFNDR